MCQRRVRLATCRPAHTDNHTGKMVFDPLNYENHPTMADAAALYIAAIAIILLL